ncbi:MAG TPA: Ig-like domain-containing protein [Spirochaetota bacterium]|nr:Ig-like domain-containing protein [Spirochaetota bacterium]HPS86387.1 Ig-like domain-containing protein [Spirochaetota bacterium]
MNVNLKIPVLIKWYCYTLFCHIRLYDYDKQFSKSGQSACPAINKCFMLFSIITCLILTLSACEKNFDTLEIVSSSPANNTIGVLPEFYVEIEFNNDVNKTDIEDNFSISGSGSVPGNFQWESGKKFRYIPANPVTATGRYVMEIPRSVRDTDGNTMDTDFVSDFYIGNDFTPPSVLSSDPPFTIGASDNIAIDHDITINFSKSMNRESVEKAFRLNPDVPGHFIWSENVPGMENSRLTYVLLDEMTYGKLYSLIISESASDISGNSLGSDYRVNFITGNDFVPPHVNGIYDASVVPGYWLAVNINDTVNRNVRIAVDFSEPMDRASCEGAFSMTPSVQGNYEWFGDTMIFTPAASLDPERNYQIYIDKTAKDITKHTLESVYTAEIKTAAPDSLYVKCGNIWGSPDGITYTLLSAGIPPSASWPLIITMGMVQDYYIRIQFVSSLEPYTPDEIIKYSVLTNKLIETFKSGPGGIDVNSAEIIDVAWENSSTVIFKFNPVTNKTLGHIPALYRLTLSGRADGIKDIKGNYAQNDIVIEFREAL